MMQGVRMQYPFLADRAALPDAARPDKTRRHAGARLSRPLRNAAPPSAAHGYGGVSI